MPNFNPQEAVNAINQAVSNASETASNVSQEVNNLGTETAKVLTDVKTSLDNASQSFQTGINALNGIFKNAGTQIGNEIKDAFAFLGDIKRVMENPVGLLVELSVNDNNYSVNEYEAFYKKVTSLIESDQKATIKIQGALAVPILTILHKDGKFNLDGAREFILRLSGIDINSAVLKNNPIGVDDLIVIVAIICFAIVALGLGLPIAMGISAIFMSIAIVMIIGVIKGKKVTASPCAKLSLGGTNTHG